MWAAILIPVSVGAVTLPSDKAIADALMDLALRRGPSKTFCPSEVARCLAEDWRPLMPEVRRVAAGLPLTVTQRGQVVAIDAPGPIRLALQLEQ